MCQHLCYLSMVSPPRPASLLSMVSPPRPASLLSMVCPPRPASAQADCGDSGSPSLFPGLLKLLFSRVIALIAPRTLKSVWLKQYFPFPAFHL